MNATYASPAAHHNASSGRMRRAQRGQMCTRLTTSSAAHRPHSVSSTTWPRLLVVNTEYQEQLSATAINGTITRAAEVPNPLPVACDDARSSSAHCATKHSSATVATERPITTLASHESTITSRGTSNTGMNERYAQPA